LHITICLKVVNEKRNDLDDPGGLQHGPYPYMASVGSQNFSTEEGRVVSGPLINKKNAI